MLNFLLTAAAFILSTATFTLSYTYSGVARTFTSFGKSMAELSIVVPNNNEGPKLIPYFDRFDFEERAKRYFDRSLRRYLASDNEYTLTFLYFDAFNEFHMPTIFRPTGVRMTFKCPVSWFGTYKNEASFVVTEGAAHE